MGFDYVGFGACINLADAWRVVVVLVGSESLWSMSNGIQETDEHFYESWR